MIKCRIVVNDYGQGMVIDKSPFIDTDNIGFKFDLFVSDMQQYVFSDLNTGIYVAHLIYDGTYFEIIKIEVAKSQEV